MSSIGSSSSPQATPVSTPISTTPSQNTSPCLSPDLETSGRRKSPIDLFARWRPTYHFQASTGWMNDPCAPFYDKRTGLYHIFYQWNPHSADWGDISWGSATSKDMLVWELATQPALIPDTPYDGKGVFTGCMIEPTDDTMTCVYTSVSSLPIHYTLSHPRGSESLSMAKSNDGGKTWIKCNNNPILPSEPFGLDVCGWRDPFVARWPRMSTILQRDPETTLFGIISGGIRDVTPTAFLYAIDLRQPSKWEYLGPLFCGEQNIRLSRWSGDLGKNWEVTNFTTLIDEYDETVNRDFLIMGTEGCLPFGDQTAPESGTPGRPFRGQLWLSGALQKSPSGTGTFDSQVGMRYEFGGHLDHGSFYAANSFYDPLTKKHIIWGWITEEDLSEKLRQDQGWSGLLSLPREISLQTIHHVVCASSSSLPTITSIETTPDDHGSFTIRTLASQPVPSVVEKLRLRAAVHHASAMSLMPNDDRSKLTFTAAHVSTKAWELDCTFELSTHCATLGLSVVHAYTPLSTTTLTFDPLQELISITRPSFNLTHSSKLINSSPEKAPHTLFTTRDHACGREEMEKLRVRIWRDNSVLEVFVNGRTAISTRVYAADSTLGIAFFAQSLEGKSRTSARLTSATLWDGIGIPV